ncbi:MAG: peptidylprolyl isomerase, partial [Sorangiineae bacterium PRO1]|nr:peptidylprolyl isomerase [Sorangiineae bacterium PRO1]
MRRLVLFGAIALACTAERDATRRAEVATLPDGVAARVGDDDISAELVARVAAAQSVSPAEARERLVSDALF